MKDFTGKPITIGCIIVYPGRQSSNLWMTRARVINIKEPLISSENKGDHRLFVQPLQPTVDQPFGRPTLLSRVDLVAVI